MEGYAAVGSERGGDAYTSYTRRTSDDDNIRLAPYKQSTLELSDVRSPGQYNPYKLEESPLAG